MSKLFKGILAALILAGSAHSMFAAEAAGAARSVDLRGVEFRGDLDGMIERRVIRIGVPFSRSLYFLEQGRERGVTAEIAREFERWLNAREGKQLKGRPVSVVLIPTTRDKLMTQLADGRIDIAAGNLTATPERRAFADFYLPPETSSISELIVTGPDAPALKKLDDLSGKTVHVRSGTSYHGNLQRLNARFRALRRPQMNLVVLPDALEDEDKLEMLNAGILQFVVVDDWVANIWAQVLPNVTVRKDLVLRAGQKTGWAIRKDSPRMAALLDEFYRTKVRKTGLIPVLKGQLASRVRKLDNNAGRAEMDRFQKAIVLFRKYGDQYQLDPTLLAAQGYQESQLKQETRSHVGAIGVMQVMPATGRELKVGDIRQIEPNIHAGTKYMDKLMSDYFQEANFDEMNRTLFAFASYNAGPGNIRRMRNLAKERGLDPDVWFNNVELVTADRIGMETTTYVRNILKYYVSYKLILEGEAARSSARQGLTGQPAPAPAR